MKKFITKDDYFKFGFRAEAVDLVEVVYMTNSNQEYSVIITLRSGKEIIWANHLSELIARDIARELLEKVN